MEKAIIFKKGVPYLYKDEKIYLFDLLPNPDSITYTREKISIKESIIHLIDVKVVPVVTKLRIKGKEYFFDFIKINIPVGLPLREIYGITLIPVGTGKEVEVKEGLKNTVYLDNHMDSSIEEVIEATGRVLGKQLIPEEKVENIIIDIKSNGYGIPQTELESLKDIDSLKNLLTKYPYLKNIYKINNPEDLQQVSDKFLEELLLTAEKIPLNFVIIGEWKEKNIPVLYFVERIQTVAGTELGKLLKDKKYSALRKIYTYYCRNGFKDSEDVKTFSNALKEMRSTLIEYYKDIRSNMVKSEGHMFIRTRPLTAGITDDFCLAVKHSKEVNLVKVPVLPDNEKNIEMKYVPVIKENNQPYLYLAKYYYYFNKIKNLLDKGHKGLAVQQTTEWIEYLSGKRTAGLKELVLDFKEKLKSEDKEEYKNSLLYRQLSNFRFSDVSEINSYPESREKSQKVEEWYNHTVIPILPLNILPEHINERINKKIKTKKDNKGAEQWKKQIVSLTKQ